MRSSPAVRLLILVLALAGGVLTSAYAVGHTFGAGTARQSGAAGSPTPRSDDRRQGSAATASPSATPPDRRYGNLPPLPPEAEGAFGSRLSTGTDEVALTFDDGPDPGYTPQILALLRTYRVKATFCMIGQNVQAYPELVRAVVADGHTLCNHSWSHDVLLGSRSRTVIEADLSRTDAALRDAAPGAPVRYFRQPGGNWTPAVVDVARNLGMSSLHWAVDPRDWTRPGADIVYGRVLVNTGPGSIVLLHDGGGNREGTVVALDALLPELLARFQLGALPTSRPPNAHGGAKEAGHPTTTPGTSAASHPRALGKQASPRGTAARGGPVGSRRSAPGGI